MSLQEQKHLSRQIQETKKHLRLFNQLFTSSSIEEFLLFLYKATNRRFKLRSLVLCWHSGHFGPRQYVCDLKGVYKKNANYNRSDEHVKYEIKVKDQEDSQFLADSLGRPVQSILSIPICTSQYSVDKPVYIFVEFFAKDSEKILYFYQSILPLVTKCLDYLLLQDHLKTGVALWTSTFNELKEPLVVFDEKSEVSNANKVFDIIFDQKDQMSLNQKNIQKEDRVFERHSYPVHIKDVKYNICHYVDISESLNLRNQMIQNIKMSALGELGESVAHQLSNPLTGVLSMAQLLLNSGRLKKETQKDIQTIAAAVSRSQEIISNLLDFSRANSQLDVCNLNEIVQKTVPLLKSVIRLSEFQLELFEKPVLVKTQSCLLQQVIFNLVKNACQAVSDLTDSVRQQVKVCVYRKGDQAILCVEDSGRGIKAADYENVFKPFFTTKSRTQGTGLGLSMSRNIVESFKGSLKVGRSPLGGACFTMSLPLEC